ncbi:hypothetical protein HDU83_009068 [Entophlyctis luteolus]|nr:hypothetical protein HDU83_009068 [Entophlyctis luteolus]KAJ3393170.1 hypothetical protein HDU84_002518 [Entophlyctis sp. JEL0112]
MPSTYDALSLISAVCWTFAYLAIIYRGFKDQSYGMPLMAFCFNIAWEATFGLAFFSTNFQDSELTTVGTIVWFVFDIGVGLTIAKFAYVKYWSKYAHMSQTEFYAIFISALLSAFVITVYYVLFYSDFTEYFSNRYSRAYGILAYIINFAMSVQFIGMAFTRGNADGQSVYIAAAKCIGTV